MGDRAVITFVSGIDPKKCRWGLKNSKPEFSPTVYLHWMGSDVVDLLRETCLRRGDEAYSSARFTAAACNRSKGNLGVGLMAPPPKWAQKLMLKENAQDYDELSNWHQGDNGAFMVDVDTGEVWQYYYIVSEDYCSQHQHRRVVANLEIGEDRY